MCFRSMYISGTGGFLNTPAQFTHTHFDSVYSGSSVLVLPLPVSPARSLTLLSGLAEMMENRSPREEGANHSGESGTARDTLR